MVRASLGTDIADPVARLQAVHESTAHSKAASAAVGERMLEYAEFVPGALVVTALRVGVAANLGEFAEQSGGVQRLVSTIAEPGLPRLPDRRPNRSCTGCALAAFAGGCGLIR